jgi:hypothetical protein
MNIQAHLDAFDGWLTSRIDEAHAARKDLAFRDLGPEITLCANAWEYSLLEPGARSPAGEGWSVYRLQGVWPEFPQTMGDGQAPASTAKKSILDRVADALFGPDHAKPR